MSDKPASAPVRKKEQRRRQAFAASTPVNLLLIVIFLGPWLWAFFVPHAHTEGPGHTIEDTFASIRSRERASWHSFFGGSEEEDTNGKVGAALDRVEAALKKPVLDKAEIQQALDDLDRARNEAKQSVSDFMKTSSGPSGNAKTSR